MENKKDPALQIIPQHYGLESENSTQAKRQVQFENDGAHSEDDPEDYTTADRMLDMDPKQ